MHKTILLLNVVLILAVGTYAFTSEADKQPKPSTITVTGEGTVTIAPDQVEIRVGVVTQSDAAQGASAMNAQKTERVVAELKKIVGEKGMISTIGYSLTPNYRYPESGGNPQITGYTASNTIYIKSSQLDLTGKIIDVSSAAGANNIESLRFSLKDESAARDQALQAAANQAMTKAKAVAAALKLTIARVRSVEEQGTAIPLQKDNRMMLASAETGASTTIEPGEIEVRANINLIVEVQ